jgi:FtsH-binding integral membrane protein
MTGVPTMDLSRHEAQDARPFARPLNGEKVKAKIRVPLLFVIVYLVFGALFLTVCGAVGHGWGVTAFYYLGFPLSYVANLAGDFFDSGEVAMATCALAGIVQSALLGYLVQRLLSVSSRPK